jgi:hypothetical protein
MNSDANVHNALKIGIDGNGLPVYNNPASRLFLNRLPFDGARILNPARPADLYITSFEFNAPWAKFASPVDAKTAVQVLQFTSDQLNPNISVPRQTSIPTLKYCPPSAGPFVDTSVVAQSLATAQRDLTIKLYNSVDCNPLTANPAVLTVPHTRNACNSYIENATSTRAFKIRCMAGEQYNGIVASSKYLFQDYNSFESCSAEGMIKDNPFGGNLLDSGR